MTLQVTRADRVRPTRPTTAQGTFEPAGGAPTGPSQVEATQLPGRPTSGGQPPRVDAHCANASARDEWQAVHRPGGATTRTCAVRPLGGRASPGSE